MPHKALKYFLSGPLQKKIKSLLTQFKDFKKADLPEMKRRTFLNIQNLETTDSRNTILKVK